MNLQRMRYLMNRLPMAQINVDRAMASATGCTQHMSDMPHGGGEPHSRVEDGALRLIEAKERLNSIRQELSDMRKQLRPLIDRLADPLEQTVMQMRYLEGMSVRRIAIHLSYSEQHIFRTIRAAEFHVSTMEW